MSAEISEDALIILCLVLINLRERAGPLTLKRAQDGPPLAVSEQDFYPPLGLVKALLTLARKLDALFKKLQALFERQVSALQLAHDPLKRGQLRLETFTPGFCRLF